MAAGLPLPELSRSHASFSPDVASGAAADRDRDIWIHTDERLYRESGVRVAFSERTGGFSLPPFASLNLAGFPEEDDANVAANRSALLDACGAAGMPAISPLQVHGVDILELDSCDADVLAAAQRTAQDGYDAVVVSVPGVAGLLCFADCLPLVLVAPGGSFAVAHCGWRGAAAHLGAKSLERLVETAGCAPSEVNAYIGPYIHVECFEVGPDTAAVFEREFGCHVLGDDGVHVNIGKAVATDLLDAGLSHGRLADVGLCSVCNNDRFFSFRAENGTCGRHGALAFVNPR